MRSKLHFIAASAIIALVACSCKPLIENPIHASPSGGASPSGSTGSLVLDVSAIAPCIINSDAPVPKAYLYATSVTVGIRTSAYGTDVIAPVTQTLDLSNTGGSGTGTLTAITGIPVGAGYYVYVNVYNSAYGTDRTVSGYQSGVTISENASTDINIICTPYSPTTITPNISVTPSLAAHDEAWYRLNASAGQLYTIQPPSLAAYLFLYDSTGTFIADVSTASYALTPTADATYYLGVASGAAAVSPVISVSAVFPAANEGSVASPIALALDTDHTFLVGTTTNNDGSSYYSFTSNAAGTYYISAENGTFYNFDIYSDSSFSALVRSDTYLYGEESIGVLAASTAYYLKITNPYTDSNISMAGRIVSPSAVSAMPSGQGSVSSPVALTLGTAHAAGVGGHVWNNRSYYTFTTGSTATFSLDIGSIPSAIYGVYCYIGTDSTFVSYNASKYFSSASTATFMLAANTTYYLLVASNYGTRFDTLATFTMTPNAYTPSYISLALGTTASATPFTAGTISSTTQEVWYRVTLPNSSGGSYSILWDDDYSGSGSYTLDVAVSAYHENDSAYFVNGDSGYTTPRTITVPAGESSVRIRVISNYSYSTGTFGIKFVNPSTGAAIITIQ